MQCSGQVSYQIVILSVAFFQFFFVVFNQFGLNVWCNRTVFSKFWVNLALP